MQPFASLGFVKHARRSAFGALLALAVFSHPGMALARHPEVVAELGEPRKLGDARYQVLAWSIFDAELWATQPSFSWDQPFALSLTYQRDVRESSIVTRSVNGMADRVRIASPERLTALLQTCFTDVRAGDRFTGVSLDEDRARFYLNGRQTCEMSWPGFRRAFFGIWLDGRGDDPAFSARLTGGRPSSSNS